MEKSILYELNKNELQYLLDSSNSYSDVLRKVGLNSKGANPETLKKIIKEYQLDETKLNENRSELYSRCAEKTHLKTSIPIEEYLNNKMKISSSRLLVKLVQCGYKEYKCECCGISEWMDKPISLQLHHKDGDHDNNALDNLEILCPNCHTQTDNYGGKSSKSKNNKKRERIKTLKQTLRIQNKKLEKELLKEQERKRILSELPEDVLIKPLIYKDLDFSDKFLITSTGELFSLTSNKFLKKNINNGYYCICVSCGKRKKNKMIKLSIAVAFNFVDGYQEGLMVRHKDGNKLNNNASNLEWATQKEISQSIKTEDNQ